MNSAENKIERQIQQWVLIGPLVALMTATIIIIKAPTNSDYLAVALLLGLPFCWKWKFRGLAIATGILAAFFTYHYSSIPEAEVYWNIGMCVSIALSFVVTALSFEEISDLLQSDSLPLQPDPAIKNQILDQVSELKQSLAEKEAHFTKTAHENSVQLQTYKEIVDIARAEITATQSLNERLGRDNIQLKQDQTKVDEKFQEAAEKFKQLQELAAKAKNEIAHLQDQLHHSQSELINSHRTLEETNLELIRAKELSDIFVQAHEEQMVREAVAQEMSDHIETLSREKELLQGTVSKLQSELEHLKDLHQQNTTNYTTLTGQLSALQIKTDQLSFEKEQSLQELQVLRSERDALAREIEEKGQTFEGLTPEAAAWRQAEAKYLQLQGQFGEKSNILDETRRELFLTQEKLLQLQRDIEEHHKFTLSETEEMLTAQLLQIESQAHQEVREYQKEVADLHEIINTLMKSK